MLNKAFYELLTKLSELTYTQSKQLQNRLNGKCSIETIENTIGEVESCPHCQSHSLHKWGVRSHMQRYRCKECHKSFNALIPFPINNRKF